MERQPEYLADYFIETYRDSEIPVSQNMNAVMGEFLGEQIRLDRDFDSQAILNAVNEGEDYDWEGLKDDFRIFLEKRFDRHHDGDLDNPERTEPGFDVETHYSLGYIGTDMREHNFRTSDEVFMTSVVQFQDTESDGEEYAVEVEYLDQEEGLEAVEYLLERGQIEKVESMITHAASRRDTERALKAYEKVVEENPRLARNLMHNLIEDQEELEDSLKALYFEHNPEVFESFRDQLDF